MTNYLVPDMDDVSLDNAANGLNWVLYLRGKYPKFKCTLFVIPGRSSIEWIKELAKYWWLEIVMHGWNHDEKEEITQKILDQFPSWFIKVYKGPNWKVNKRELKLLKKNNVILAVKERIDYPIKQWSLTDKKAIHGHAWIESDWKKLEAMITPETEFKFISEAV